MNRTSDISCSRFFFLVMPELSSFLNQFLSAIGADKVVRLNQEYWGLLESFGMRIVPMRARLILGTSGNQPVEIVSRLLLTNSGNFRVATRLLKQQSDIVALKDLAAIIADGIRRVGFANLSEEDYQMIGQGTEFALAYSSIGLKGAALYFRQLARAYEEGFLEPFLLLEGLTDYPWVRPRPEDWANLPIAAGVGRSQFAAASLRSISERMAEFPPGSHRSIWALMRRLSDTFDSPPITRRLSEALDVIMDTSGGWPLAEALAKDLNYIKSISVRYALNEAFKKPAFESPPES